MAIQNRRGNYEDFVPSKMLPGEFAVVQNGDPNSTDGKAVYMAFQTGDVRRLATYNELQTEVSNAAEEIAQDITDDFEQQITPLVNSASQSASNASASATQAQNIVNSAVSTIQTAGATQVTAVQAKGDEVLDSIPADYTDLSDDVTALKADFTIIDDRTSTGIVSFSKPQIMSMFEVVSRDVIYRNNDVVLNVTTFANIPTSNLIGAVAIKIRVAGAKSISYPVFKSTGNYGCFMMDKNDVVVWGYIEASENTGSVKSVGVPENADWFLLSVPTSLANLDWEIKIEYHALNKFVNDTDLRFGITYTKTQVRQEYAQYSADMLYRNDNIVIGTTKLSEIPHSGGTGAYAILVDVSNADYITYPVFKTTGHYGSFISDAENVVIWAYDEKTAETGTLKTIQLPDGAKYMLLSISPSLAMLDWTLSIIKDSLLYNATNGNESDSATPFHDANRNLCLAGIKTDILTNKIPYHRGFLFHKLQNDDGSLWYGTDFSHIRKIGTVSFSPSLMRFAISPKDGRIIAVQRDTRNGIWVWDGTVETHVTGLTPEPQAWLYNSGVDFINDGDDEYCIFAEYYGTVVEGYELHVWRGKFPYTDVSNWEKVFTQAQRTNITHFHMIRRDPWTNILYLTAGDSSSESKWWYSTDFGATWTLLVSGTDSGWGNSLCRTINFVFTEDYIYWATDHGESSGQHHTLNRIARDASTGIMDLSTKEQLTVLPQLYATNSLCYVESPNGLFMYDRIDTASSAVFGAPIKMLFWDFATEQLIEIASLRLTQETWGGSRGKCYLNYTNSKQPMPAMGFSIDTPCIFDIVCDNPSNIGTIAYDVGAKTIHTVDY